MAGVRMGEMVVSTTTTDELVARGLGSCIGLAIVDRRAGVAGLAHIVLPESPPGAATGKFADTAVPELVERMRQAGGVVRRMEAAIAGGAHMFDMSGGLDIGARNEQAVRAALLRSRVALRAAETGGSRGRTLRVDVGRCAVSVRAAGQPPTTLLDGARAGRAVAARAAGHRSRAARSPRNATSTTGAEL
jgi:chemotaxis protein CheD